MMSYTDYDLCDYRDGDYELLAYLEQWERAQPKPPATSEQITVSTTRDLMRATKNSERQEFKNILAEMQETADLVAAMTASGPGDTVLDEMVTEHQYPRSKKISWIHACKYDLLNFYCVRCVQLKKILSPSDIDQDDLLPSWKLFNLRGISTASALLSYAMDTADAHNHIAFLELMSIYQEDLFIQQILDRKQGDIDELVYEYKLLISTTQSNTPPASKTSRQAPEPTISKPDCNTKAKAVSPKSPRSTAPKSDNNAETRKSEPPRSNPSATAYSPEPPVLRELCNIVNKAIRSIVAFFSP